MFFDVYFSVSHGFEIDFPFINVWISTESLAVVVLSVVALRIRKVIIDRKRSRKTEVVATKIENDFFDDIDWSK